MNALLIGAGPMAVAYAKALRAQGVAFDVVGRGQTSAATFNAATGIQPLQGGLSQYLSKRSVDALPPVIVAVPIPQLAGTTTRLIAAGARNLLVEKPAGLDSDEIGGVLAAAKAAGAKVHVAYNRRFYASVDAARRIIAEDGGVSSFHVDFSELIERIVTPDKDAAVLANWVLGNASHMLDLAFYISGAPETMSGAVAGSLPWHKAAAVFTGHGRTKNGALFTWHADWNSVGRWGLDVRTPKRRLLFQPVEKLQVQDQSSFAFVEAKIDDRLDSDFKPGVYRQLEAFLSDQGEASGLLTLESHASLVRSWLPAILCSTQPQAAKAVAL